MVYSNSLISLLLEAIQCELQTTLLNTPQITEVVTVIILND
jgi:hypothetical protein